MTLPLTYISGNCFINAYINKRNAYKDRNLRLVFGSVSFNGFFEFGGENWTLEDFKRKHIPGTPIFDAHAWLEDNDGNIYDKVFSHYNFCAEVQSGKKLKVPNGTVWEGILPSQAMELGLKYVKADKKTQTYIFLELLPFLQNMEKMMMTLD